MSDAGYCRVTAEVIERLRGIAGADSVSVEDDEIDRYACDEMPLPRPCRADVIVKPGETAAVAGVMDLANRELIPVTPRGSGTGICGGCVPVFGGILLSMERMNRILEIDGDNLTAAVEPGVTLADLCQAAEERGLYYPLYPGESTASIGGNVATNAGGMKAVKYGVTRHQVLGLEAVLPTGGTVSLGGKFVKSSTGYDLKQLLIGSEGTLAVITRVLLRLTTPPGKREVLFVPFDSLSNAIEAVPDILRHGITPAGIEFMERDVIKIVEEYTGRDIPFHDHAAYLMIIVEGATEEEAYAVAGRVRDICSRNGAVDAFVPPGASAARKLLDAREKLYPAVRSLGPLEVADVVVPRSRIPEFIAGVYQLSERHGMPIIAYGHAGDGNVHLHLLSKDLDADEWRRRLPGAFRAIYELGASLGGVISGEHGVGLDKKGYMAMTTSRESLDLMKGIKRVFDPNNILNPGKILDLD